MPVIFIKKVRNSNFHRDVIKYLRSSLKRTLSSAETRVGQSNIMSSVRNFLVQYVCLIFPRLIQLHTGLFTQVGDKQQTSNRTNKQTRTHTGNGKILLQTT